MSEADATVELGKAREPLFHAGHADQNDADAGSVKNVADELKRSDGQLFGLVEDQQFDKAIIINDPASDMIAVQIAIDAGVGDYPEFRVWAGGLNIVRPSFW